MQIYVLFLIYFFYFLLVDDFSADLIDHISSLTLSNDV